jgi:acyl carrier protein
MSNFLKLNNMELNEFIASFDEPFDDTDPAEITASPVFHDLEEWSSLTGMSVLALAKTEYGKVITGAELKACVTVEDVFNLINNK